MMSRFKYDNIKSLSIGFQTTHKCEYIIGDFFSTINKKIVVTHVAFNNGLKIFLLNFFIPCT